MGDSDLGLLSSEMGTFKASAVAVLRSLRGKAVISGCNSQSYIIARSWRVADINVELYRDETAGIARNKAWAVATIIDFSGFIYKHFPRHAFALIR